MDQFGGNVILIASVALILAAVVMFFLLAGRRMKADVRRIREEYGSPGERELAMPPIVEAPPSDDPADEVLGQLDARIAEARGLIRAADDRIARLERAIAQADQAERRTSP